jgi:hypothetical protein
LICAGCGGNHAPVLQPIADQTASVAVELSIELRATDADGDSLHFDFDAPAVPDIKSRAQLSAFADNVAIFRWTPQPSDVSATPYAFDFSVSDGKATTTETVQITVTDGQGAAPVFREPLGTGTTLDLSMMTCIDVAIVVEDNDSTMVTISEADPQIDGSTLTQMDAFTATWHWCPTAAQIAQTDHYLLQLVADDGTNQTQKSYLIVLRSAQQMNCPGAPPSIMHTPLGPQSTVADLQISADLSDDVGVKSALLYWTTTMPSPSPDVTMMTPVTMSLQSGDATSGTWQGTIPNPVASAMAGTKQTVYYIIEARDNDDPTGTCDHTVDAPATGTFAVDVTNPGGTSGTGANCDPCSSDTQCMTGFECISYAGGSFCAAECTTAGSCDANYSCSAATITSLGGKTTHFCRATSMTCPPTVVCVEDSLEQNDSRTTITNTTSADLPFTGTAPPTFAKTNLVVCPRNGGTTDDEDWYGIDLPTDAIVTGAMTIKDYSVGSHADLDLELDDNGGNLLDASLGVTTTEYVSACQPAAATKSFLRVFTSDVPVVASKYDLTVTRTGPDANEAMGDNDHQTSVFLGSTGASVSLNICNSDDWFITFPADGDAYIVDLKFTSRSFNEDLTLTMERDNCTPSAAPATVATGGPIDGGLRVSYHTPDGGSASCFYVVVGAANPPNGGNVYQLNSVKAP